VLAALDGLVADLDACALTRFEEIELDRHSDVAARRRPGASAEHAATSEERVEQVADRGEGVEIWSEAARAQTLVPVAVVRRSTLRV